MVVDSTLLDLVPEELTPTEYLKVAPVVYNSLWQIVSSKGPVPKDLQRWWTTEQMAQVALDRYSAARQCALDRAAKRKADEEHFRKTGKRKLTPKNPDYKPGDAVK